MKEFEKNIVKLLNNFHWKPLDFFSWLISNILFLTLAWITLIVATAIFDTVAGFRLALGLVLAFAVHYVISEGLIKYGSEKLSLRRVRPYAAFPSEIKAVGRNFSDSSFPSSHVSSVVGGLVVVSAFYPTAWPLLVIFALLLAFSRLHNGMHYPSDILAGIILGLGYGYVALHIMEKIFQL